MPTRKTICSQCGKIVEADKDHECTHKDEKRLEYNRKKREYYHKNKETLKPLMTKRWKDFRIHIIKRDGTHCQRCFVKYNIINSSELQVHHIKSRVHYPELMFDDKNVVTLCKTCNIQLGINDVLDFEYEIKEKEDFML